MAKERKVVYVEVEDRNPFGESVDDQVFNDPQYTSNHIPGWSDERHQNDLRTARGEPIVPLKCRFHWARCKDVKDTEKASGRRVQHWKQKRYEIPSYKEVQAMGYDLDENEAITEGSDGKAYWGEHVLMMASAEVAAAHYQKVQQANREQEQKSGFIDENLVTDSAAKEDVFASEKASKVQRR
jgi:hypothetical protein